MQDTNIAALTTAHRKVLHAQAALAAAQAERARLARQAREAGMSLHQIGRHLGVSGQAVKNWTDR